MKATTTTTTKGSSSYLSNSRQNEVDDDVDEALELGTRLRESQMAPASLPFSSIDIIIQVVANKMFYFPA